MKITKLMCMALTAVLLASCGGAKADSQEKYREISAFANICMTDSVFGEFYFDDNDATHFFDYTSMNDVFLCSKPNCKHTPNYTHTHTDDVCSAYDLGYKPCLYGDKLYYMTNEIRIKDNSPAFSICMRSADIDGTNRKSIAELEGYQNSGNNDYLVGYKLYFTAANNRTDDEIIEMKNGNIQYREEGIWCYNFPTDTFELIYDRYNDGYITISLVGYWQGKLYFRSSEIDEEDYIKSGYYAIDLESKEVTEAPSGFVAVSDEYLITTENDTLILHKDNDTRIVAEGFEYEQYLSVYVINGKMFSPKRDYCFDTYTGKCRKVNISKSTYVRAYLDGSYILWGFDFEAQKPLYSKVLEDEFIGDEIS